MTDLVNHPPHYKTEAGIEAIDVIEQYGLGYHLGNAMKYLLRAGRKSAETEKQDVAKAHWYLVRWRQGVEVWRGVESSDEIDEMEQIVHPLMPHDIADAFGLSGLRRDAVINILMGSWTDDSCGRIRQAEACLRAILGSDYAPAEA